MDTSFRTLPASEKLGYLVIGWKFKQNNRGNMRHTSFSLTEKIVLEQEKYNDVKKVTMTNSTPEETINEK